MCNLSLWYFWNYRQFSTLIVIRLNGWTLSNLERLKTSFTLNCIRRIILCKSSGSFVLRLRFCILVRQKNRVQLHTNSLFLNRSARHHAFDCYCIRVTHNLIPSPCCPGDNVMDFGSAVGRHVSSNPAADHPEVFEDSRGECWYGNK